MSTNWSDHKIKFFAERCRDKTVLDIGCVWHDPTKYTDPHWVHAALREVSKEVVGLDLDGAGVAYLKVRGFNVFQGDAQNFNLGRSFDVIVAGDLIEHLQNPEGFLRSCRNHMNSDSLLLVTTPNPWFWRMVVKSVLGRPMGVNAQHTCWFCPDTYRELVRREGLKVSYVGSGSRSKLDRMMPLPHLTKSSTFHFETVLA